MYTCHLPPHGVPASRTRPQPARTNRPGNRGLTKKSRPKSKNSRPATAKYAPTNRPTWQPQAAWPCPAPPTATSAAPTAYSTPPAAKSKSTPRPAAAPKKPCAAPGSSAPPPWPRPSPRGRTARLPPAPAKWKPKPAPNWPHRTAKRISPPTASQTGPTALSPASSPASNSAFAPSPACYVLRFAHLLYRRGLHTVRPEPPRASHAQHSFPPHPVARPSADQPHH